VGNSVAPPVGPPATTVSNVSLLAADLMRGGQGSPAQTAAVAPAPAPRSPAPSRPRTRRSSAPAAPAPEPAPASPATNTTG
jgi:hypothetical protein